MSEKRKKTEDLFDSKLHIVCTLRLNERMDAASTAKGVTKSCYIRNAIEEKLNKDGF